jgi:ubiquinone biosynthesis protein
VTGLVHQVLLTVLGAAAGLMAVLLFAIDSSPQVTDRVTLFGMIGTGLLIVSVVLGLRVLVLVFRHDLE